MNDPIAVARREFRSAFNSPVAYVVILGFLILSAVWLFFFKQFFPANQADLRDYFGAMPYILAFLVPALTMRTWAEERRTGTYELLLTLPFGELSLVVGKFIASLALAAIAIALTLAMPISLSFMGDFDPGVLASQYLGIVLVAAAAAAIGQWVSSLAKNQVSAFLLSALILLFLVFSPLANIMFGIGGPVSTLLSWLSLATHYEAFGRGIVDTRDLGYFLTVSALFLYLSSWNLARRKWS